MSLSVLPNNVYLFSKQASTVDLLIGMTNKTNNKQLLRNFRFRMILSSGNSLFIRYWGEGGGGATGAGGVYTDKDTPLPSPRFSNCLCAKSDGGNDKKAKQKQKQRNKSLPRKSFNTDNELLDGLSRGKAFTTTDGLSRGKAFNTDDG